MLLNVILPDLTSKIEAAGSELILYQKFPAQGCYRDPVRSNNIYHIYAGVMSGIDKMTFGGGAVWESRAIPHFEQMGFLFDGTGHPGPVMNYMTACALSSIITGINPINKDVYKRQQQRNYFTVHPAKQELPV